MFSLENFKSFLGFGQKGVPGTKAVGQLTVTKVASPGAELSIPKSTLFNNGESSLKFFSSEVLVIPPASLFGIIRVVAQEPGSIYNIPASQTWSSSIGGISITNGLPFVGGLDPVPEKPGLYPGGADDLRYGNDQLEHSLALSEAIIKSILAWKEGEDFDFSDPRLIAASNLIAMFFLENNTLQEKSYPAPTLNDTNPLVTKFFRTQVYRPLMEQVSSLLSHKTNFMRAINGQREAQTA